MTTYSYSLPLNDGEIITLAAAIELLLERCERELKRGPRAPYLAWQVDAKEIQTRLYNSVRQTSGSAFGGDAQLRAILDRPRPGTDNDSGV